MKIIERMEAAQAQTWWLPETVTIHEGPDHCCYQHSGEYSIVRFSPAESQVEERLGEILQRIGRVPARMTFFPHRHSARVRSALLAAGFRPGRRYEARAIEVAEYSEKRVSGIQVVTVDGIEDMRRVYGLRSEVFGGRPEESDETLQKFVEDATGPDARVRQFLAVDAHTGEALCQAGMSLYPELGLAFLFAGGTAEQQRGRGAYTALVAAWIAFARSRGIEHVGLFAREDTSAPIVTRHGFAYFGEMFDWHLNT